MMESNEDYRSIYTGFVSLDKIKKGWRPGELCVVGYQSNASKLSFITTIIHKQWHEKGIFMMLMSKDDLKGTRYDSYYDMIPYVQDDMSYTTERDKYTDSNIMPYAKLMTALAYFENDARMQVKEKNVAGLFIDWLHALLLSEEQERIEEGKTLLFAKLKSLARELNIPIIVAFPMDRKTRDFDDLIIPLVWELKLNESVVEIVDSIFLMHRPEYYKVEYGRWKEPYGIEHIIIVKNRYGDTGKVKLRNYYQRCFMSDVEEEAKRKVEQLIWQLGLERVDVKNNI